MNELENKKNEMEFVEDKLPHSTKKNGKNARNRKRPRNKFNDERKQFQGKQKAPVRNNASLYFSNPILAQQVSDFSFNQFMGSEDCLGPVSASSAPTIATYWINPCPGYSLGEVITGINVDGLKLYTTLSANNAKTTNYAPQDVTTLLLAMGEVISLTEVIKRAMGVAYTYNVRNRSLPIQVVTAMGIDPAFITAGHLATLRVQLNTVLNRANSIPFFGNIPYLEKCRTMYQVYYADSESPMAQLIIPMPMTTWTINETISNKGTVLKTTGVSLFSDDMTIRSSNRPLYEMIATLSNMVTQLMTSSTFNYIYSDMLRVFGDKSSFFTFDLLPEGYAVFPEFNPMFNIQMHNATPVGVPLAGAGAEEETPWNDVYPNPELLGLRWNPQFMDSVNPSPGIYTRFHALSAPQVIDFPHSMGDPTVDQKVDATRYKVMFKMNDKVIEDATFPDHYVSYVSYLCPGETIITNTATAIWTDKLAVSEWQRRTAIKSKFDYDTLTYVAKEISKGEVTSYDIVGDLDFWTTIDFAYLKGVNDLCAAGLYEMRSVKTDSGKSSRNK